VKIYPDLLEKYRKPLIGKWGVRWVSPPKPKKERLTVERQIRRTVK
jgi:hypothetical protein